jgi:dTDP-4-amino-4,6-dideoxygalactose transaminase
MRSNNPDISVPLLDLKAQYTQIREEIEPVVKEVIESQYFIMGPKVQEFEKNCAKYCNVKYALGVSSGTDAILLALMALNIKPGDEVITTTYSFFATAGCISRLNAVPVFIDIDPDSYNLDPNLIEEKITDKTKAIIPVHLYGQMADMDPIIDLAERHNLKVIEDAAQAIGSEYKDGQRAGSMGEMGCFSFFPSKNLGGFGDGGLITTNDDAIIEKLTFLRNHGAHPKYHHKMIGGNFRLDALQAAVLNIKLKYLDNWTEGRQKNADYYDAGIVERGLSDKISVPVQLKSYRHIFNQYILQTNKRNELIEHLKNKNIGCEIYYPVTFNNQECFKYLGYNRGEFPVAEKAADETLAIPIYPELTQDQKDYILNTIRDFFV